MSGKITRLLCVAALACGVSAAEDVSEFLDVYVVHIKPEKRAEFEASVKKMVEANRKNNGDTWLTYTTEYGEAGTYYFSSPRTGFASIETASASFMKALTTSFGKAGMEKIFADLDGASVMSRAEIRRRRPDLSANPFTSQEELRKLVGQTHWLRTVKVELKPGKMQEYVELWNPLKLELEKLLPGRVIAFSQTITGPPVVYTVMYAKSFGEFDEVNAATKNLMETEAYQNYMKGLSEVATMSQFEYHRVVPALSNVPDEIASADEAFWRPAPTETAKTKTATKKKATAAE